MSVSRTPRKWDKGDEEPAIASGCGGLKVRDNQGDVWAYNDINGLWYTPDTKPYPWEHIARKGAPLTEVLPEPTKAKAGDRVIATQLGRQNETVEGILEVPENPVDEPATVCRDDGIRIYIKDVVEVLPGTNGKITAPWDDRTVIALNAFQNRSDYHPFTCPREHFTSGEVTLFATNEGWVCTAAPACGYTQDWAHAFMTDVPPVQLPQEATNSPSLVSVDTGTPIQDDSGQLRGFDKPKSDLASLIFEAWRILGPNATPQNASGVIADWIIGAGWRPPLRGKELEVDSDVDAWYVRILDDEVHHTSEGAPANIDWTRDGRMIGVELLGAGGPLPADETVWEWGYRREYEKPEWTRVATDEAEARFEVLGDGWELFKRRPAGEWQVTQ